MHERAKTKRRVSLAIIRHHLLLGAGARPHWKICAIGAAKTGRALQLRISRQLFPDPDNPWPIGREILARWAAKLPIKQQHGLVIEIVTGVTCIVRPRESECECRLEPGKSREKVCRFTYCRRSQLHYLCRAGSRQTSAESGGTSCAKACEAAAKGSEKAWEGATKR